MSVASLLPDWSTFAQARSNVRVVEPSLPGIIECCDQGICCVYIGSLGPIPPVRLPPDRNVGQVSTTNVSLSPSIRILPRLRHMTIGWDVRMLPAISSLLWLAFACR